MNLIDPTGMFSTHTDEEGNVIAVYDDGDLGVYQHDDATTKEEVDAKREKTGTTSGGGAKKGRTAYIDEFARFDNSTGEALKNPDGSFVVQSGVIHFDEEIDELIEALTVGDEVYSLTGLLALGYLSIPGMPLDIKSHILNAGDGYLLRGVYVSGRSAGNFRLGRKTIIR